MKYNELDIRTRLLFNKPYRNEKELVFDETKPLIREWVHSNIPLYLTRDNLTQRFLVNQIRKSILKDYVNSLNERNVELIYNENIYDAYIVKSISDECSHIKEIKMSFNPYAFEPTLDIEIDRMFFDNKDSKAIIVNPFDEKIYEVIYEDEKEYQTVDEQGVEKIFLKEKEDLHYFEVIRNEDDIYRIKSLFTYSQSFIVDYPCEKPPETMVEWLKDFEEILLKMPELFRSSMDSLSNGSIKYTYFYKNPYASRIINLI